MELVYCWIARSENGFLEEQGFNFYGEHQFSLRKEEKKGEETKYFLEYEYKKGVLGSSLYQDSPVVTNISAIVGENGSGKSTILNAILHFNNYGLSEDKVVQKPEYIAVFRDGDVYKAYYHLVSSIIHLACRTITIHDAIKEIDEETFDDVFSLVISTNCANSNVDNVEIRKGQAIKKITQKNMSKYQEKFFYKFYITKDGFIDDKEISEHDEKYDTLHRQISKLFRNEYYQSLFDMMYFANLKRNNINDQYLMKFLKPMKISAHIHQIQIGYQEGDMTSKADRIIEYQNLLSKHFPHTSLFYANLLCELLNYLRLDETPNEDLELNASYFLNLVTKSGYYDGYFLNALEELAELEEILKLGELKNDIPSNLLIFRNMVALEPDKHESVYWKLFDFVDKVARKPKTFVLKYLKIEQEPLSSGERAIQNLFSWLSLLPFFKELEQENTKPLGTKFLLLIDEIDLYVHPEWQRKLINHLITELEQQFPDKKIQIILTTHSPFVLSDIPVENCTFLKPKDGEFSIKNENLSQTFAANLHTIAKNQFFMESTMGAYAQKKLNELDAAFQTEEKIRIDCNVRKVAIDLIESTETELFINSIGEPVIHQYFKKKREKYYQKKLGSDEVEVQDIIKGRSDEFLAQLEKALEEWRGKDG